MGGGPLNKKLTNSNNWLETAKLVHRIATQITDFLSHIEEFQKRLWLKKKFVRSTDYCLTLDRVPEEFYPDIVQNAAQLAEWKDLFAIHEIDPNLFNPDFPLDKPTAYPPDKPTSYRPDKPTSYPPDKGGRGVNFLKQHPNLILDTYHFDSHFKDRLLAHFDNLDNETDGLLIHGENFQALNMLMEKYQETIQSIYIDPPYNTKGSDFLYKNQYKHASWLSLMADRTALTHEILSPDGGIFISIDDNEQHHLRMLMDEIFGKKNIVANFTWWSKYTLSNDSKTVSYQHENILSYAKNLDVCQIGLLPRTPEMDKSYKNPDEDPKGPWKATPLHAKSGSEEDRYSLQFSNGVTWHCPEGRFPRYTQERLMELYNDGQLYFGKSGKSQPNKKTYLSEVKAGKTIGSLWPYHEVGSTHQANEELASVMGKGAFNNPKGTKLIQRVFQTANLSSDDIILDFFAGSGTTAHATINLNRKDNGNRKYILIEIGHHFDTVLMPRVKKAIYAEKWKDAKPISRESRLSHTIKYQHIESYEDALNNIKFNETEYKNLLLDEHQLSYMLENDTKESPTFLNISKLQNPFNYQLNIVKDMQTQKQSVDLPETFNYLLGITVQTRRCLYDDDRRYLVYRGTVAQKSTVIIWRETAGWEPKDYERDYNFIQQHKLTDNATEVYINTDSIVPGAKPLDPLFKKLMFSQTTP